jgi:hypothetical protein
MSSSHTRNEGGHENPPPPRPSCESPHRRMADHSTVDALCGTPSVSLLRVASGSIPGGRLFASEAQIIRSRLLFGRSGPPDGLRMESKA